MKKIAFLLLFMGVASFAQQNINNYKYIIVPKKFSFLKEPDRYQTSSLTKFLFNREGFTAFMDNENLPQDVANNRCLALTANVKDASGMLLTKNSIELVDCNNKVVFTTLQGKSKLKDYKKAYHEAIRNAFKSISALNYTYKPSLVKALPIAAKPIQETKPVPKPLVKRKEVSKRNTLFGRSKDADSNNPFGNNRIPVLYAQRTRNGFQLLNVKQQVVFNLLETKLKELFIIRQKDGILYKENGNWIAEFYDVNGNRVERVYDIRISQPTRR